jgi:5-methylcytosine-specific restriction protein A
MAINRASWRTGKGSSSERGYTWAWTKARRVYLAAHPLCVMCSAAKRVTAANVVDHIIPHEGNQELFWDESNWQSLCKPHHDTDKAEQEGRHRVRAKFDDSGRVIW